MKRKLLIILGVLVLTLTLAVGITACGQSGGDEEAVVEEEQGPIINPLTGAESPDGLPVRPVIVSIDNVGEAVPQSNLSYADLIYEFPVEGLQTRLEAVFYTQHPDFVGPIRSTRPYFVDLTREYQGVFVAYGWSPDAKRYLKERHVPWINGMVHTELYHRVSDKPAPHNAYIDWENIEKHAKENGDWFAPEKQKNIRPFKFAGVNEEEADQALADEMAELAAASGETEESGEAEEEAVTDETAVDENAEEVQEEPVKPVTKLCDSVKFDYTYSHCAFDYDEENGVYLRSVKGSPYIDKESGEQMSCKNILVQEVSSEVLDYKGRLAIDMCEGGKALLFTNGTVVKGTWSRADLDLRTVFVDENGNQFELTPGNSWVEVVDQNCTVSYEAKDIPEEETSEADNSGEGEPEGETEAE